MIELVRVSWHASNRGATTAGDNVKFYLPDKLVCHFE